MRLQRARRLAQLGAGYLGYLRTPLDVVAATAALRDRVQQRDDRFLDVARRLIYAWPASPLRALLLWAGCSETDLERHVRTHGLETTLATLRDAGVRLSLDEVKGRVPIRRRGLELPVAEASFDNPLLGGGIVGHTSGSRGDASRVLYGWEFFAEEAANELLLYDAHGALDRPGAFWLPGLPSISGVHNLLIELKLRRAPERWFSHLAPSRRARAALTAIRAGARLHGVRVPPVEATSSADAVRVVRWMLSARDAHGGAVVKAFASSAVRIAAAARELGASLDGCLLLAGGEPLTERRRRFIRASGARVHPRYVTTETGLVAGSCGHTPRDDRDDPDDPMHVYTDRLAVTRGANAGGGAHALLFTTLSPVIGKVLLNADLGDVGRLLRRPCDCAFGRLGMDQHVAGVRSSDKMTVEGMTVSHAVLDDAVGAVVEDLGGSPDAYQLVEEHDASGLARVVVKLSPALVAADPARVAELLLSRLERHDAGASIAARFWRDAGTVRVVHDEPALSAGAKLPHVVRRTAP